MKKYVKTFIAAVVMSSLVVTPVFAEPGSVNDIQSQKKKAEQDVNSLQSDLTKILVQMDDIETSMIEKGEEIIQATSDLEKAQKKEKKQYEDMKKRIKMLYENGDTVMLTKIFESGTISEMLQQAENVQALHTYDRTKLKEFVQTKQKVETLKTNLEEDMSKMKQMKADLSEKKQTLGNTLEQKKAEVKDLDQQLQAAAAEAARKAAEEQKRKEQAQANQNKPSRPNRPGGNTNVGSSNSGNTNGGNSNNGNTNSGNTNGGNSGGGNSSIGIGDVSTGQAIVAAARRYIGVPYVWGGMSASGVDCSGLTSLAHRAVGIYIPRNSSGQAGGGKNVGSLANALPGDIICYPGHVAIYIGRERVIHAPTEGENVKEASVYMGPLQPITAIRRYW